jgi:hypothetical protein
MKKFHLPDSITGEFTNDQLIEHLDHSECSECVAAARRLESVLEELADLKFRMDGLDK